MLPLLHAELELIRNSSKKNIKFNDAKMFENKNADQTNGLTKILNFVKCMKNSCWYYSNEEKFYQNSKYIKERYKGRGDMNISLDCFWVLKSNPLVEKHKRKSIK